MLREWGGWGGRGARALAASERLVAAASGSRVLLHQRGGATRALQASRADVSCLALVSSVDFMLAAGSEDGQVTVFQIPKPHSEDIPNSIKPKPAQIERYTVGGLHKSEITHLEWSKNGMKLFSGDKDGVVVLTEIDFYMHICKSSEIINESYEIVQLSYFQNYLLISSVYRCIICHYENDKWTVNQVGKKDRKTLCKLGGVFHFNYNKPNDLNIYSARPGLRLWTSDKEGNVLKTLLFKEAILNPSSHIELLNPVIKNKEIPIKDLNFGRLHIFNNYILSYNEDMLYILDPEKLVAVATIDNIKRIISVAVNNDEIFILDGDKNIIRIAYHPEDLPKVTNETLMTRSLLNPIELAINTIKDLASSQSRKHSASFSSESAIAISTDCTTIVKADECFELPPVVELSKEFGDTTIQTLEPMFNVKTNGDYYECDESENIDIFNQSKLEDICISHDINKSQILYSTKKCKSNMVNILSKEDKNNSLIQHNVNGKTKDFFNSESDLDNSSENCISLEHGSSESLEEEIRDKEEKLAKILNLEPLTKIELKHSHIINKQRDEDEEDNYMNFFQKNKVVEKKTKAEIIINKPPKILPLSEITPDCVAIPNLWNLKEIKIKPNINKNGNTSNGRNRKFDDDWELV